jgi:hypothetical protein
VITAHYIISVNIHNRADSALRFFSQTITMRSVRAGGRGRGPSPLPQDFDIFIQIKKKLYVYWHL